MERLRHGERWAFELLYERYFDKLTWFARGFLDNTQKAQDVVQEVFIRIIEKPGQFDGSRRFSTWVYTVTGNACKNIVRNEQNRTRLLGQQVAYRQAAHAEMHHESDLESLQEGLRAALNDLNEKETDIYRLRFEQELGIKEIAGILDIPEGSVKSGIYYLLKKLAKHLTEFEHGRPR